jgi:hypothetical protein
MAEKTLRKVICEFDEKGVVDVRFIGSHLSKRELLRLIRAIKLKYRERVRIWRHNLSMKLQAQAKKEAEVEAAKSKENEETKDLGEAKNDASSTTKTV